MNVEELKRQIKSSSEKFRQLPTLIFPRHIMTQPNEKLTKLFYSISEVAAMFDVNETLLRYWEKEFPQQIKPKKNTRGTRQYTPADIEQIRVVYNLVKGRGMKLAAAREALRKNKEGEVQALDVIVRLKSIREELAKMRDELETM